MLTEEQDCTYIELSIRVDDCRLPRKDAFLQRLESLDEGDCDADTSCRLFELNTAPTSFAERHPRFMIVAATATIFLVTLTAEIDYLRASGYYWP
jgi:hypothetical protein